MKHEHLKRLLALESESKRLTQPVKKFDPATIDDPELRALMERFDRLPGNTTMRGPVANASRTGIHAITPEHTQLALEILSYLGSDEEPSQDFKIYDLFMDA